MNVPRNEWLTPGSIIGVIGLIAAGAATYSKFDGRMSVAEANSAMLEKRLDRLETKLDYLVGQSVKDGK